MRYRDMPPGETPAYAPASEGPFSCGHCKWQMQLQCQRPEVIREFITLGNVPKGRRPTSVPVEAGGCCAYQEHAD